MKQLILSLFLVLFSLAGSTQSLEDARTHTYYHRFQSAKNVLQQLISSRTAVPDAWYWLAELYLDEKKTDSARQLLLEATGYFLTHRLSKKQQPLIYIGWAHLLLDDGSVSEARAQMEEILQLSKYKDPVALLAVAKANIQSKNGDIAWAHELLEKAARRDKNNPDIYMAMGDAYRKQINGSKAVISYDKALALNPSCAEALYKKGLIYKSQKNTEIFVDRFTKAVEADPVYAPVLYELYYHYFYRDLNKAGDLLNRYIAHSDPSPGHAYMMTDYLYLTKKYESAVRSAKGIIDNEGNATKPRIHKLIAYSYAALGDSIAAEKNMDNYFLLQKTTDRVSKDYELMARLTETNHADKSVSLDWYKKALSLENDQKDRLSYMLSLADIQKELGNSEREALWRESIFKAKKLPTNVDIYNWGMALYMSENYSKADSVFGLYAEKYPTQVFGYFWQARCNAILDSTMEQGLAVPHYKKLLEVASTETKQNAGMALKAYAYLGTYEANIRKDYPASLSYFEKMLELDPDNSDALKYVAVLKKWIETGAANRP